MNANSIETGLKTSGSSSESLRLRKCSFSGCDRRYLAKGFCSSHYQCNKRYGSPVSSALHGAPRTGRHHICQWCGKAFYRTPSAEKRGENKFCSRRCGWTASKGMEKTTIPMESKVWRLNRKGYLETTVRRKRIYQHRYLIELHLGRPLEKYEIVHHLNGNKSDNNLDNLLVLDTKAHSREHRKIFKRLLISIALLKSVCENLETSRDWKSRVQILLKSWGVRQPVSVSNSAPVLPPEADLRLDPRERDSLPEQC